MKGKPTKNYLDLFINTSLNHMSIRPCIISQPINELFLNSELCHEFIANDFWCNLTSKSARKNSTNLKLIQELWMKINILKYVLSKYY